MYLREVTIRDIKCFDEIRLDFSSSGDGDEAAVRRWTVILGENGLGKSSLLQSIAIPLAGPGAMRELVPVADGWVRLGRSHGEIEAELEWTEGDAQLPHWPKKTPYHPRFAVTGADPSRLPEGLQEVSSIPVIVDWVGAREGRERETASKQMSRLKKTAYAEGKPGWFACGYGPFRRLSGGSQDADRILYSGRRSARFVTLFREDAALTSATEWLVKLHNTGREGDEAANRSLAVVQGAFEKDFLLEPVQLQVDARHASLKFEKGAPIPFSALSDGYRSMLALGIDLMRWLIAAFPSSDDPLGERGVVLIDELDAHLHPQWQRRIGEWLLAKFPRLQFIVVTHSPFLAQVRPDGNMLLRRERGRVVVHQGPQRVSDWRVDQVLTELFDLASVRSVGFEQRLANLLALRRKAKRHALEGSDRARYEQLELWAEALPAPLEDGDDRALAERLRKEIQRRERELGELE